MISVIIPLYNKEDSIKSTIDSILSQTYTDLELVIINDGSTDESEKIVKKYLWDKRISYYFKENSGVSATRNYGLKKAKGEWIMFLDADDQLYPDALRSLAQFINNDIDIICGTFDTLHNNTLIKSKQVKEGLIENNYKSYFHKSINLRMGAAIIRKDILLKYPFDENLSRYEDMKAILTWIKNAHIYNTNNKTMIYRTDYCHLSKIKNINNIDKDFVFHLDFRNKSFWEKCILGELLYLAYLGYQEQRSLLLKKYKWNFIYAIIAKLNLVLIRIKLSL